MGIPATTPTSQARNVVRYITAITAIAGRGLAIDKLAAKNNGIRDFRAYTTLVTIMQGNYTRRVKDKAFEVMAIIRGY